MFWGGVLLSVVMAVFALRQRSWLLMLISLLCYLPFALYLSVTPRFSGYAVVLIFHIIALVALGKNRPRVALWASCVPVLSASGVWVLLFGV